MIAPLQQQSISLRISVTDRCQQRCLYCMPPEGVPKCSHHDVLRFEEILRFVRAIKSQYALSKVHITGGEPLVRPDVSALIEMLAGEGIEDIALTTNGHYLPPQIDALKRAGLNRLNISLDTLNPKTFAQLTRGGDIRGVMKGLNVALSSGLKPIKLNVVVMRGFNSDEVVSLGQFALDHSCEVRFLELMPIGPAAGVFDERFVSSQEVKTKLLKVFDLFPEPILPGVSSKKFLARDSHGKEGYMGFISSHSDPFCSGCNRLRLTACGELVGCLALGKALDIKPILRMDNSEAQLISSVREGLGLKRKTRDFVTPNTMILTGG